MAAGRFDDLARDVDPVVRDQPPARSHRFGRCGRWDSNPQWANPPDPKSGACANSATPACLEVVGRPGFEPGTHGLRVRCAASCASDPVKVYQGLGFESPTQFIDPGHRSPPCICAATHLNPTNTVRELVLSVASSCWFDKRLRKPGVRKIDRAAPEGLCGGLVIALMQMKRQYEASVPGMERPAPRHEKLKRPWISADEFENALAFRSLGPVHDGTG